MKVLKFSGASVGSIANLQNVKRIVDEVNDSAVIVVSAVDGVTDWLFSAVEKAIKSLTTHILENHLYTCVTRDLENGDLDTIDELISLFKRFNQ